MMMLLTMVVVMTMNDYDYDMLLSEVQLIVDTRGRFSNTHKKVIKA